MRGWGLETCSKTGDETTLISSYYSCTCRPSCIKQLKITWEFLQLFRVFWKVFYTVIVVPVLLNPPSVNLSIKACKKILHNTEIPTQS